MPEQRTIRPVKRQRNEPAAPSSPCVLQRGPKLPFDIDLTLHKIRHAIASYRKAAMFELADAGYKTLFEQLVACIISIRTLDEVTVPTAKRLFERAHEPKAVAKLSVKQIDELIGSCSFHEAKAATIRQIAFEAVQKYGGSLPSKAETLLSLKGVGPKCANLALGVACDQGRISVDIHVRRIVNRWGYLQASTPEQTMLELKKKLPQRYWIEINALLVPFGKHICKGIRPHCSTCPVLRMCRQIGVTDHR